MPTNINFDKKLGFISRTSIALTSNVCPPAPAFVDTNSFEFDGTASYFDGNGVVYSQLDNQTKVTFSFWVKPTTSTFRTIFSIANGSATPGEAQVICFLDASNRVRITFGAVTNSLFSEVDSIQVGFWNHVFIAIDLTQGSAALEGRVYIDGIDKTDTVNLTSLTQFDISAGDIYIADDALNYQGKFLGYINELAIWPGEDYRNSYQDVFNLGLPNDLNNLPTNPIGQTPVAPHAWFRMGEVATYDGSQWIMSDVNNCYKLYSTGIAAPPAQPTTDIPLFNNKSFTFDGSTDYIDVGNPANLQITGNLTLSAWFNRDVSATSSNYMIIGKDSISGGTRSYMLLVNPVTNKIRFIIWKLGTAIVAESTTVVTNGVWYHAMGVNDGTDLKLYVNGNLETTIAGGGGTIDNGTSSFEIGRRAAAPATRGFWNGEIDEVAVWDSDQSANASAIGSTIATDLNTYSPLSWWRMGEDGLYNSGPGIWSFPDNGSGGNNSNSSTFPESARVSDVPT